MLFCVRRGPLPVVGGEGPFVRFGLVATLGERPSFSQVHVSPSPLSTPPALVGSRLLLRTRAIAPWG